jgi:hypothetical protein
MGRKRILATYVPRVRWLLLPNKMGTVPLYGDSGFDNFYNNYMWTMVEYEDALYVGTMDWSHLLDDGLPLILAYLGLPPDIQLPLPAGDHGADLLRFASGAGPAEAVSTDGLGNPTNYEVRTMVSQDALYLGTANPMNLMTDPGDGGPVGGWELIRLGAAAGRQVYLPQVLQ